MIRTPAHKQTNGSKLPGQIVAAPDKAPGVTKDFDRHPYLKTSTADKTLGEYYKRKQLPSLAELSEKLKDHPEVSGKYVPPKKLTFEEWYEKQGFHLDPSCEEYRHEFEQCWQEAQKNV